MGLRMKNVIAGLLIGVLSASAVFAEPETYDVGVFRAIEVQQDVRLDVSIAEAQSVSAIAIDGDVSKLRIREFLPWIVFDRNTRWLIFPKWREDLLQVSVQTPVLNGLKAFDGAQATFSGDADERLWIETGHGGLITLPNVRVDELTLVAREGGAIVAAGRCDRLTIRNEGVSVDASAMDCASFVVRGDPKDVTLPGGAVVVDAHPEVSG